MSWNFKDDFWFDVTFVYSSVADEVYLIGDFNGWKISNPFKMMPRENGGFSLSLPLSEGFYHYKFLVDGEYKRDDKNPHVGGVVGNSVMFVHMDPNMYCLRDQTVPLRTYYRQDWQGNELVTLLPELPPNIASFGLMQRKIFIYLPPSYYSLSQKYYPVVYAHDGQNLFSTPSGILPWGGWYLDEKLDHWWSAKSLPEFILVAIPNSDFVIIGNRQREYTSSDFQHYKDEPYVHFVKDVVKKEVDSNFRTLQGPSNTFTLGASLGGLVAFLLCLTLSDIFSCAICLSPAFWFVDSKNESVFTLVESIQKSNCRIYIDSGDGEADNKELVSEMAVMMYKQDWTTEDFMYYYDECKDMVPMGITHSEHVWRERVINGLKFAFCK